MRRVKRGAPLPHLRSLAVRTVATMGLLAALATGCSSAFGETPLSGDVCTDDSECPEGVLCRLGVCASTDDLGRVHLEVRPPSSSGLPTQQVLDTRLAADTRIEVTLAATLDVNGVVETTEGEPVPARIVAVHESPIPGRAIVASTTTSQSGGYTLSIVERVRHLLTVYPDDAMLPPFVPGSALVVTTGMATTRDIVLPAPESLVSVSGRVVAGGGAAAIGMPDLEVRVFEESGRRVSSVALTDEDGGFTLTLSEQRAPPLVIEIRPGEQQPFVPVVRLAFDDTSADVVLAEPLDLGAVGAPVPVAGHVVGPDSTRVAGAALYFRGLVGAGEVRRQLTADADGTFDADFSPGTYEVAVVAPLATSHGGMLVLSETASVEIPSEGPLVLALSPRPVLTGDVVTSSGEPAAGTLVHFARIGGAGDASEAVLKGAVLATTATTATDGTFTVPVDVGRYRVTLTPPAELLAPSTSFVRDVFASPEHMTLALPPPRVAAGVVTNEGGAPVADAQVRVFSSIVGEDGAALALGEGMSDAQGAFTVLVPDLEASSELE